MIKDFAPISEKIYYTHTNPERKSVCYTLLGTRKHFLLHKSGTTEFLNVYPSFENPTKKIFNFKCPGCCLRVVIDLEGRLDYQNNWEKNSFDLICDNCESMTTYSGILELENIEPSQKIDFQKEMTFEELKRSIMVELEEEDLKENQIKYWGK